MDGIILENFRCFGARQVARLAPLTLLVGENSTGKTSFLALIRALWDVAGGSAVPVFSAGLYPLGSFSDIIHERGTKGKQTRFFEAGISDDSITYLVHFEELESTPYPVMRRISTAMGWVEIQESPTENPRIKIGVQGMEWTYTIDGLERYDKSLLVSIPLILQDIPNASRQEDGLGSRLRLVDGNDPDVSDYMAIAEIEKVFNQFKPTPHTVASGPTFQPPLRVYVPGRDQAVVSYLSNLSWSDQSVWLTLKSANRGIRQ